MSFDSLIIQKFLNDEAVDNITEKINELQKLFSNFNSKITKLPDIEISVEELEIYKAATFKVARLSINLFLDFPYYKRFKFKEKIDNVMYKERLKYLGYEFKNGMWECTTLVQPSQVVIEENIFIYHAICQLLELKVLKQKVCIDNCFEYESSDFDESPTLVSRSIFKRNQKMKSGNFIRKIEISNNLTNDALSNMKSFGSQSSDLDESPTLISRSIFKRNQENDNFTMKMKISNNLTNDALSNMKSQSRESSWACKNCSFVNGLNLDNCGTCFILNESLKNSLKSIIPIEDSKIDKLIITEKSLDSCQSVSVENPQIDIEKNRVDNYWLCQSCTFKNKFDCLNCETCMRSIDMNTPIISELVSEPLKNPNENNSKFLLKKESVKEFSDNQSFQNNHNDLFVNEIDNFKSKETFCNCLRCRKPMNKSKKELLCDECSKSFVICCNEACTQLYKFQNKYCDKCKVFKNSDMKNGNLFEVKGLFSKLKKWQCSFCFLINDKIKSLCRKCGNPRFLN